jgi:hypothetical protein
VKTWYRVKRERKTRDRVRMREREALKVTKKQRNRVKRQCEGGDEREEVEEESGKFVCNTER